MKLAWRDLVALKPVPMPLLDSVRLTAPAVVALVGLASAGQFVLGLVAALGAYIVLFGAGQSAFSIASSRSRRQHSSKCSTPLAICAVACARRDRARHFHRFA